MCYDTCMIFLVNSSNRLMQTVNISIGARLLIVKKGSDEDDCLIIIGPCLEKHYLYDHQISNK